VRHDHDVRDLWSHIFSRDWRSCRTRLVSSCGNDLGARSQSASRHTDYGIPNQRVAGVLVFCSGDMAASLWIGVFLKSIPARVTKLIIATIFVIGGVLMIAAWDSAYACAVCGTGKEGSRIAFLLTTALLTLVPLALIGGGVAFLVKRNRQVANH